MNKVLINYYAAQGSHDAARKDLDTEVDRIVTVIRKFFHRTNAWWDYRYTESEREQPLPRAIQDGCLPVYVSEHCSSNNMDYSNGFPVEFFDMTNAEITKYLDAEKAGDAARDATHRAKEALDRKTTQEREAVLRASAAAKLTKEELAVLQRPKSKRF